MKIKIVYPSVIQTGAGINTQFGKDFSKDLKTASGYVGDALAVLEVVNTYINNEAKDEKNTSFYKFFKQLG